MDGATAAGSNALGERTEVFDSRSGQQICEALFGSACWFRHPGVEDTLSNTVRQWNL